MFRIGIDFDNTIACYDRLFPKVATELGLIADEKYSSKNNVKQHLLTQEAGDLTWQKLQGKVYGKYMLKADIFHGFYEFLCLSKLRGVNLFIVSHKSEFGHFDEEKFSLRKQALKWLQKQEILGCDKWSITESNIFFESTRKDKIDRIKSLQCTHFIDDLPIVLTDSGFPNIQKLWFNPSARSLTEQSINEFQSWRQITNYLYNSWTDKDIVQLSQHKFPDLNVQQALIQKGQGNSKIYKLLSDRKKYILKIYPDRQRDPRPRLETESLAYQKLFSQQYPVPECIIVDNRLGWGIYSWIDGQIIEQVDRVFLKNVFDFVRRLFKDSRSNVENLSHVFSQASEACISGRELIRQIEARRKKLAVVDSNRLQTFLTEHFDPYFQPLSTKVKSKHFFEEPLPQPLQILSPADFGSHNAIKIQEKQFIFLDFEYFGWDDPVKLVSDLYWHPAMNLSQNVKNEWLDFAKNLFIDDDDFQERLDAYLPLYGLRWCLILLNEFRTDKLQHRLHAQGYSSESKGVQDIAKLQQRQLNKAKKLLTMIQEMPS
ncbi:phosphotransferase [Phormidium sp. CCY1219]|uniref:phosphotransferase n=1 Tax=Phormidium sp. CCY1219 TaxID=2886104 RepID=UPI002D1EBAC9|nr:phosphotransferase [Phormidium sp. CCY1219]MEB3826900.1 aminoglycoside phosphotransferase family protein [Phormidium sp. CCY1219]